MASESSSKGQITFHINRNGKTKAFDNDCIVGIQREEGKTDHSDCTLLYVEVADTPEKAKIEERTVFKRTPIYNPPTDSLTQYGPDDASFWIGDMASSYTGTADMHVIISTGSGSRLAETCFDNLISPFLETLGRIRESDYTVHVTDSAESIINLAKSTLLPAAANGTHLSIILLSGDGGIVDLLNGLMSNTSHSRSHPHSPASPNFIRPKIALIPTGTGNALANSTGVLADRTLGLSTLYRGQPLPLPTFKVTLSPNSILLDSLANPVSTHSPLYSQLTSSSSSSSPSSGSSSPKALSVHGAVVFSFGLHASLVADSDTPEYRQHGSQRFQMAGKDLLFPPDGSAPHAYRARVSLMKASSPTGNGASSLPEWQAVPRDTHAYVLVTLVAQLEKGFMISPASEPLDGKLRIVQFGPMEKCGEDVMGVMKAAYEGGKHTEDERVGYEEIEGLKIEFQDGDGDEEDGRWRRVCIDGKIFVVGKGGRVVVEREEMKCLDLMWLER